MGRHRLKGEQRDYAQNLDQLPNLKARVRGCGVLRQVATNNVRAVDVDRFVDVDRSVLPIGDPASATVGSLPIEQRECHFERLNGSLRFWRILALALLQAIQRRDPGLARTGGTIAETVGRTVDSCLSQTNPDSGVLRRLVTNFEKKLYGPARKLDGLADLLKRGKSKPPTIHDDALAELYIVLTRTIPIVRRLEHAGSSTKCAETIVSKTFPLPNPFGLKPTRAGLIEDLTEQDTQARLDILLTGAARWAGLPAPSDRALEEMRKHVMSDRAPAEAAKMIVARLTALSVKTISNRLTGKIRFTHGKGSTP